MDVVEYLTTSIKRVKSKYDLKSNNLDVVVSVLQPSHGIKKEDLEKLTDVIQTLSKCRGSVHFHEGEFPGKSSFQFARAKVEGGALEVYVKVEGLLDLEKELSKVDAKEKKLGHQLKLRMADKESTSLETKAKDKMEENLKEIRAALKELSEERIFLEGYESKCQKPY